ncbi:hypothetical protein [Lewinella sp. 4G2]|uniref:hypothetical protein n=1 Tax=Lewinella sp. 4G2 TaxID=1803372 RepID=UPI0007B4DE52|nr:hypothetical protein [Lewinella sp. 4G2]OAV43605.1 hypothetical protein A3850_003435 [Lewinella sp. 4G2]
MKELFSLVIVTLIIIGIFQYRMKSTQERYEYLHSINAPVTGQVQKIAKGTKYTFTFRGKKYTKTTGKQMRSLIDGEKYTVFMDPNDPQNSIIDFHLPMYDTSRFTQACATKIQFLSTGSSQLARFNFNYQGQEFKRFHYAARDSCFSTKPSMVWVKLSDPRISYLTCKPCF